MRLIIGLLAVGFSNAYAADLPTKIATIDMQHTIQSVSEGKKARDQLQKDWEAKRKQLEADGKKIQDQVEQLRKQSMVLDEKSRREKEEAIQQQVMQLREQEMRSQTEFQNKDRDVSAPIIKKIREIVGKISKEKNYTLVIDGNEGAIVFSQGTDDITEQVIKQYDAKK